MKLVVATPYPEGSTLAIARAAADGGSLEALYQRGRGRWHAEEEERHRINVPVRLFNPGSAQRPVIAAGLMPVVVRGHRGWMLRDVPWLGKRFNHGHASRPCRSLERAVPLLFSERMHAFARQHVTP